MGQNVGFQVLSYLMHDNTLKKQQGNIYSLVSDIILQNLFNCEGSSIKDILFLGRFSNIGYYYAKTVIVLG